MDPIPARGPAPDRLWRMDWATEVDQDPRLELKAHVGPVTAVAYGVHGQRPWVAVGLDERGARKGEWNYRLRVGDLLSGQWRELACDEPVRCLEFAMMSQDPVLVSGHRGGRLRFWGLEDGSPRQTADVGDHDLRELYFAQAESLLVTRDANCRLRCFSLPSGEPVEVAGIGHACAIDGGRLADGRHAVLMGGEDGVSLWDLDSGRLRSLPVPQECLRLRGVALSTVDGRACATVMDEAHRIATLDISTGALTAPPIKAHMNVRPDGLMEIASVHSPHPPLAAAAGTLAVPTPWRVHLWNLGTSQQETAPLAGPVAGCLVQAVRWQDRDLLLTASAYDGVVALWSLDQAVVRPLGHEQRICQVAVVAEPDESVVSADEGGTIVARHANDGRLVATPVVTGVESTRALAAWRDGDDIIAAQGAGSRHVGDGKLRRWNLTGGQPHGSPIDTHLRYVHNLSRVALPDGGALVTFGPGGILKLWRPGDGALLAETQIAVTSKLTGFTTGTVDGRPFAVLSCAGQPITVYPLDDLTAPPIPIAEAVDRVALAMVGPYVVAGPNPIRVWHLAGHRIGPDLPGEIEVTAAAGRNWPAVFIGRADGTVSLTDLETGEDLCPPLRLPTRPTTMTVTGDGDLIVGFGSDVARVRPPV